MTHVLTLPEATTAAAGQVAEIGSTISSASTSAARATTGLAAAAQDEVSAMTAALFSSYAQDFQLLLQHAGAFHQEFAQLMAAAGSTYSHAEADAAAALGLTTPAGSAVTGGAVSTAVNSAGTKAAGQAVDAILIMSSSGFPTPQQAYLQDVFSRYLSNFVSATGLTPVSTPEGLYPFTGVKDLTLDISLARGVTQLNNAIMQAISPGGTGSIAVLGYSQSAIIASLEMPKLLVEGYNPGQVFFTLLGDPSNPNGGLLARFPGLSLPSLGLTAGIATPSNDFATTIFTLEYDGFADFPQYPIDVFSDLNALAGILFVHGNYPFLTAGQLASAITLPQSGAPSMTTYELIPTQNLPLLEPLRAIPFIGNPLADLVQPDLRYLVNWGYGNPAFGYSTGPADVTTPFGFLPPLSATTALGPDLISGAQQGISAFASDMFSQGLPSPPAVSLSSIIDALTGGGSSGPLTLPSPASIPSTVTGIISGIQAANSTIAGGLVNTVATAYSTLLPTADIATAVAVSIPSYDVNLFLSGITQAVNGQPIQGLINAIGNPIAADVGLATIGGGFELIAIANSLQTIFTGVPNPNPIGD
ncbi:PE-PPE domain-containing protein [Mycobacterium sp. 852002-51057_SCH5723018]|uniref:PE family protein n=1 Tax=Mycobacterium sp. 852002-51057_SCH5723018 TaxID=1834094 RepID=UPI0008022CD3|nr:PE-PPE domain-containing protein [Mycobacterium sp. 852002-51057_SCH5723018]OBG29924.1 PE family protein [Mycobacterium sp. 852002-51057_SCH5723018]